LELGHINVYRFFWLLVSSCHRFVRLWGDDDGTGVDDDDVEEDDFGRSLPAAIAAVAADARGAMLESGSKLDVIRTSVLAGSISFAALAVDDLSLFTALCYATRRLST
jgi:hypothetical protein